MPKRRVFISWSGPRSKAIAEGLRPWLLDFFPGHLEVFLSTHDLHAGGVWTGQLFQALGGNEVQFGILCVTPENLKAPWMLFEAGVLARNAMKEDRVVPYLFDMGADATIGSPLSHLQQVKADYEGTLALVTSLNNSLANEQRRDEAGTKKQMDRQWRELKDVLDKARPLVTDVTPTEIDQNRVLEELLQLARATNNAVAVMSVHSDHPARARQKKEHIAVIKIATAIDSIVTSVFAKEVPFSFEVKAAEQFLRTYERDPDEIELMRLAKLLVRDELDLDGEATNIVSPPTS